MSYFTTNPTSFKRVVHVRERQRWRRKLAICSSSRMKNHLNLLDQYDFTSARQGKDAEQRHGTRRPQIVVTTAVILMATGECAIGYGVSMRPHK